MSKEIGIGLLLLLIVGYGVYYLASSPQVQELFSSRPLPPDLLDRDTIEPGSGQPREPVSPQSRSQNDEKSPSGGAPSPPEPPKRQPEQPAAVRPNTDSQGPSDRELGRVLLQILAARKLDTGLSLVVDAQTITVIGTVPSAEARRQILDVLDKGRGTRQVLSDELVVEATDSGSE